MQRSDSTAFIGEQLGSATTHQKNKRKLYDEQDSTEGRKKLFLSRTVTSMNLEDVVTKSIGKVVTKSTNSTSPVDNTSPMDVERKDSMPSLSPISQ